jgi:two-component system, chemotaxis family, chemotaxis protein CheV
MLDIDSKTKLALNNQLELLCFRLAPKGTVFAMNVFKVRETVKWQPLTLLPDTNDVINGLLTLRDQIIPVVDLNQWLYDGFPPKIEENSVVDIKHTQIIIAEFNNVIIGVQVYKAEYILRKNWEDIMEPITNEFGQKVNNYTKTDKDDICYIVDVERMLTEIFPEIAAELEQDIASVGHFPIDQSRWVLVAEDSDIALKALCKVLNSLDVRYKTFGNGQDLIDYVAVADTSKIGLIITDLEMPIASGFTVIKEMKSHDDTRKIPIVVNSSMSGSSNREMAEDLNAEGFIAKTDPSMVAGFLKEFMSA